MKRYFGLVLAFFEACYGMVGYAKLYEFVAPGNLHWLWFPFLVIGALSALTLVGLVVGLTLVWFGVFDE